MARRESSKITEKEVRHIAYLARVKLTSAEIKKFQKLKEVDTKGVEPTSQVTGLANKLRKDEIKDFLTQEHALQNAPAKERGYFRTLSPLKK
jgi:aspartyl-tRNA(Asn)/glutamyl-tRNA(Gln) amidotransferase subunit C